MDTFNPIGDLMLLGTVPGYVRDGTYWHKAVNRVTVETQIGKNLRCVSACGITIDSVQVFASPNDATPACPACEGL